jgi:hypothetical protein
MSNELPVNDPNGGTMYVGSDCYPVTIIHRTPKRVTARMDRLGTYDREKDEHTFVSDQLGSERRFTLRANGRWVLVGSKGRWGGTTLTIGQRGYHYDRSF